MTRRPLLLPLFALLLALPLLVPAGCGSSSHGHHGTDLVDCPALDLVFIVDTSNSMDDEATALCDQIAGVEADLVARGAVVAAVTILGIIEPAPGVTLPGFDCLADSVLDRYGASVPGSPPPDIDELQDNEDWGPATAIVIGNHPWVPGALRIVVPISDEGAYDGDPCDDPGDDRDSVEHAISLALAADVTISPIAGTGSDACVIALQQDMATATGGQAFISTDPDSELGDFIIALVESACEAAQPGPGHP